MLRYGPIKGSKFGLAGRSLALIRFDRKLTP
jgi:hypothetical protein